MWKRTGSCEITGSVARINVNCGMHLLERVVMEISRRRKAQLMATDHDNRTSMRTSQTSEECALLPMGSKAETPSRRYLVCLTPGRFVSKAHPSYLQPATTSTTPDNLNQPKKTRLHSDNHQSIHFERFRSVERLDVAGESERRPVAT